MTNAARHLEYLDAMGIHVWVERQTSVSSPAPQGDVLIKALGLSELREQTEACQRCDVAKTRTQVVFGEGTAQASWFIVGDTPSSLDDKQGVPFTDAPGQLLAAMLQAGNIPKQAAYLTTGTKCSVNVSVSSNTAELDSCRDYLIQQIALVKPNVVFVLGEQAAQSLLKSDKGLRELQGSSQMVDDVEAPIVASHTLAETMDTPQLKKQVWQDIQLAKSFVIG